MQQEIDHRQTAPGDLENIDDIKKWSSRNNGTMPINRKDDREQALLAQKLRKLLSKSPKSPMLQSCLTQLQKNAHQTPTKASQRGAEEKHKRRAAADFLQCLEE